MESKMSFELFSNSVFSNQEKKVCIVQFEAVHECITPSFVHSLNSLGFTVDIYLSEKIRSRKGDIYEFFPELNARVFYFELNTIQKLKAFSEHLNSSDYRACIFSTYQWPMTINFSQDIQFPFFGVVHNTKIFTDTWKELQPHPNKNLKGFLTLEDHVKSSLLSKIKEISNFPEISTNVIRMCYWRSLHKLNPDSIPSRPISIAVPGGISFRNRNFTGLLDALEKNKGICEEIKIIVAGGGQDRDLLIKEINNKKLGNSFALVPTESSGLVSYSNYIPALNSADFCLPLSGDKSYQETKITSAIPTSIGNMLPALITKESNFIYKIPCFEYSSDISEGLQNLIELNNSEILAKKRDILSFLLKNLSKNSEAIKKAIENC